MDHTLVPFGYLNSEDRLVDVHQVPSGKRCGCQCPSCHAPLIARKGSKKVWHFAHDSQSKISTALDKCTYSFFVSARMMALQLIGNELAITLPALEVRLSELFPMTQRLFQVTQIVTEQRQVVLNDIRIDADFAGQKVDEVGYISGYPLAIVFSHPDRCHPLQPGSLQIEKAGVLEISLEGLKEHFFQTSASKESYSDVLKAYIANDIDSKQWIFHPRYQHCKSLAKEKLSQEIANSRKKPSTRAPTPKARPIFDDKIFKGLNIKSTWQKPKTPYEFVCKLCNTTWTGFGDEQAFCKQCRTSLCVSREEISEG